jgi:hypothetical protein
MRIELLSAFFLLLFTTADAQLPAFDAKDQPAAPDYSLGQNWSALPFREDAADAILSTETWVSDSLKDVDVFYIYPTMYMKGKTWNADLSKKKLNKKIDNKPVRFQASVFNESARVYAPRYRQAIIKAFYDKENGEKALAFAYEDVKHAFEYYLSRYNNGRPIIIASHSQGSYHARRLLKEFFDGTILQKRLVAAYVIGYGFNEEMYTKLQPCENKNQTNCYITWASFKTGYVPAHTDLAGNVCVNPLTWNRDTIAIEASKSMGAILLSFKKEYEKPCATQVHNGLLWVTNDLPLISGWKNLHIADYNLFWLDIRANVKDRVHSFSGKKVMTAPRMSAQ